MLAGAKGEGEGRFALLWRVANKFGLIKFQARHKQKREREGERDGRGLQRMSIRGNVPRAHNFVYSTLPAYPLFATLHAGKKRDKQKRNLCQAVN